MTYEQEKIKPYDGQGKKSELVEQMFDNIAFSYDKLNHRLSWDFDKRWRHKAVEQLEALQPKRMGRATLPSLLQRCYIRSRSLELTSQRV